MERKLYRTKEDRMVAGVCAGFARYYGQDPVLWRLGAVIFLALTGFMPGVLAYAVAVVLIPLEPDGSREVA